MEMLASVYTCTLILTHIHIHILLNTHTRTHTHTHMHTHTHTHQHMHAQDLNMKKSAYISQLTHNDNLLHHLQDYKTGFFYTRCLIVTVKQTIKHHQWN